MQQHNIWCVCLRTHAYTPNVMLPHHHIDFLLLLQILKSVTLTRNIRAPWRWSEWWSKHVGAIL